MLEITTVGLDLAKNVFVASGASSIQGSWGRRLCAGNPAQEAEAGSGFGLF